MKKTQSALILILATLAMACSGGGSEPDVVAVAMVPSGSAAFTGVVAATVSPNASVKVVGSNGQAFAGTSVTFTASGGGQVAGSPAVSSASGIATVGGWTLGAAAGTQTLTASAPGMESVTFSAVAAAGAPSQLTIVSGNNQQGAVGGAVGPLVVKVMDRYNNPVSGATVSFQVASGGGQMVTTSASTDAQGTATAGGWVLGITAGSNTLVASVSGQTQTFVATAVAGAATRLVVASGDAQTGDPGSPLTNPLSVRVADAFGNGVPNVTVTFAVTTGGGTLTPAAATSNAQGLANASLTLTGAGGTTVTATSGALAGASAVFTASTGPTLVGSVTIAPDVTRVQARLVSTGGIAGRRIGSGGGNIAQRSLKDGASSAPEQRLSSAEAARRIDTRGRLIVFFDKGAFSLPQDARAYRSASLRNDATTAFYAALTPHEASGMIRRREVSPAIAAVRVDVSPGQDVDEVKRMLRQDPRVLDIEEDVIVYALDGRREASGWTGIPGLPVWNPARPGAPSVLAPSTEMYPSDPNFGDQMWHYRMIDLPRAWKLTTGSNAVRVAVVDAGVRADHPAVAPLLAPTGHYDFTDGTTSAYSFPQPICGTTQTFQTYRGTAADIAAPRNTAQAPNDLFIASSSATCWTRSTAGSHGTHVAGTIGSPANDGIGGTGVNWTTQIIAVRVFGITNSTFTFDIAQGILYAGGLPATFTGAAPGFTVQMPPAHVMNLSFGGSSQSTVIANAIAAASANTLIIASAGNTGSSAPNYPASYPEALSVVSLAPDAGLSSFTTVGTTVDIAAPGGDMNRFWPSAGVSSSTWNYVSSTPTYSFYQGTSMAAPHVTGVAALVWAANPGLTPAQVRARLVNGAIDLFSPGIDNRSGAGLVNAYNAVTGTRGPTANTVVRAINASTGAIAKSTNAAADGRFILANLAAGSYFVVAGQDEGADVTLGVPGRRLGWVGSSGMGAVTMAGSSMLNVGVSIGSPLEAEPNDATAQANPIVVNSWVSGNLMAPDVRDTYVLRIPAAGNYTFETSGVLGACFAALEVDTVLRLSDQNGTQISTNNDTAFPQASYPGTRCSLITAQLQPGTYFVEVTPFGGDFGSYRLHVRSGT